MDNLLLIALALFGILTVILTYRHWSFGLSLVLLLFAAHVVADYFPPLISRPLNIYPDDVVFFLLATASIIRLLVRRKISLLVLLWIGVGLLTLIEFLRGIHDYGIANAGNDSRTFFYLVAGVLYFASWPFNPRRIEIFLNAWKWVAGFLVTVAVVRWAALAMGISLGGPGETMTGWLHLRVLNAAQALFVFQAFLLWRTATQRDNSEIRPSFILPMMGGHGRFARLWPMLFWISSLIIVIVLQHRSVWVVCIFSYFLILLCNQQRTRLVIVSLFFVCMVASIWAFTDFGSTLLGESLEDSTREALGGQSSTFLWRVEQWHLYYQTGYLSGPLQWFFGKPFGAPYGSVFGEAEVSPHNWYVHLALRLGLLGFLTVAGVLAMAFLRLWRLSRGSLPLANSAKPLVFLFATQFVFSTVYSPSIEQSIYMGLAITMLAAGSQRTQRARDHSGVSLEDQALLRLPRLA